MPLKVVHSDYKNARLCQNTQLSQSNRQHFRNNLQISSKKKSKKHNYTKTALKKF